MLTKGSCHEVTEGIRTFLFPGTPCERNLTIPQSKIEDFCQLPLHKGAFGCSRTSAFIDVSQKNRETVPHSFFESLGSLRKFPEALFYRNSCPTAMTKGRLTAKATVDSSTDLAHSSGRVSVWMA